MLESTGEEGKGIFRRAKERVGAGDGEASEMMSVDFFYWRGSPHLRAAKYDLFASSSAMNA